MAAAEQGVNQVLVLAAQVSTAQPNCCDRQLPCTSNVHAMVATT